MAVDVEIAHAAGTSPKRRPRAVVFAGVAALGVFVMVVVWHLISGGDQALEAGPQLAEPDVARAVDEAVPSRPSVPDGDALLHSLPQTGGAEPLLLEEHAASSAASASLPIGPAHSAGSAPAQGAEDEAYLRQIRQQFDRQKSW
ncbi:hypothetical protein [Candidatus Dactylopiibacterium carminicum]|nr:hypothetical protein [Candidatus Dactylopiibacterium carminicum]